MSEKSIPKITYSACQSEAGIILNNSNLIVKTILSYLNNSELIKCKLVCKLWKEVAENIMNRRIIIVNRKMKLKMLKKLMLKPELLLPLLNIQNKENVQFVTELFLFSIEHEVSPEDNSILQFYYSSLSSKTNVKIRIAIFPSLPGIQIHHFLFTSEQIKKNSENKLSELIGVSKETPKCVFWFMNETLEQNHSFPDLKIPSILLCHKNKHRGIKTIKHTGISFHGKRMNAAILKTLEKGEAYLNIIKEDFYKQVEKIRSCKIGYSKSVAFMFNSARCHCATEPRVLPLFKKCFPNVPILFFRDIFLYDLTNSERRPDDLYRCRPEVGLIVLVWYD